MNRKRTVILWLLFAACAAAAVVLNLKMRGAAVEYEEVSAVVLSARDVNLVNRKTGSRTTLHEVEVLYDGERMPLENAYSTYQYTEGTVTKAYLANGRLFANEEGVRTATPLATVYFVFLFGSFGLLFAACMSMSRNAQKKRQSQTPQ